MLILFRKQDRWQIQQSFVQEVQMIVEKRVKVNLGSLSEIQKILVQLMSQIPNLKIPEDGLWRLWHWPAVDQRRLDKVHIKTYRKWSAQICFCTILQHFLVIFWQTTLVSFTKLRFLWTFWGAKHVLILIGTKLQYKTKLFFVSVFFNFVRKKRKIFWLINGHFTTVSGHFSAN